MSAAPRVRFFDIYNRLIGQVRCTANRSYVLNEAGICELEIATSQLPQQDDVGVFFKPHNRVLVENEGHEDWVGYLTGTQDWTGTGVVTFEAEGAEGLMRFIDPRNISILTFWGGPVFGGFGLPGFTINNQIGKFDDWEEDYGTASLYDELRDYFDDSEEDWGVTHSINSNGSLRLILNFWDRRGQAEPTLMLEESRDIELGRGTVLSTEGPIYNSVRVYGDGATWETREETIQTSNKAVDIFGLLTKVLKSEYTGRKKLNRTARQFIRKHFAPRIKLALTVTDTSVFEEISLGDVVRVNLHSVGFGPDFTIGFQVDLRVVGKEHNEVEGTMPIITEADLFSWYDIPRS